METNRRPKVKANYKKTLTVLDNTCYYSIHKYCVTGDMIHPIKVSDLVTDKVKFVYFMRSVDLDALEYDAMFYASRNTSSGFIYAHPTQDILDSIKSHAKDIYDLSAGALTKGSLEYLLVSDPTAAWEDSAGRKALKGFLEEVEVRVSDIFKNKKAEDLGGYGNTAIKNVVLTDPDAFLVYIKDKLPPRDIYILRGKYGISDEPYYDQYKMLFDQIADICGLEHTEYCYMLIWMVLSEALGAMVKASPDVVTNEGSQNTREGYGLKTVPQRDLDGIVSMSFYEIWNKAVDIDDLVYSVSKSGKRRATIGLREAAWDKFYKLKGRDRVKVQDKVSSVIKAIHQFCKDNPYRVNGYIYASDLIPYIPECERKSSSTYRRNRDSVEYIKEGLDWLGEVLVVQATPKDEENPRGQKPKVTAVWKTLIDKNIGVEEYEGRDRVDIMFRLNPSYANNVRMADFHTIVNGNDKLATPEARLLSDALSTRQSWQQDKTTVDEPVKFTGEEIANIIGRKDYILGEEKEEDGSIAKIRESTLRLRQKRTREGIEEYFIDFHKNSVSGRYVLNGNPSLKWKDLRGVDALLNAVVEIYPSEQRRLGYITKKQRDAEKKKDKRVQKDRAMKLKKVLRLKEGKDKVYSEDKITHAQNKLLKDINNLLQREEALTVFDLENMIAGVVDIPPRVEYALDDILERYGKG